MGIGMRHRLVRLLGRGIKRQRGVAFLHFGERHFGVCAISRTGRGHQQVIHRQFARAFHHVEGADQVRLNIGARVFEAVSHPRLRGEVDDHVGPFRQCQRVQGVEIFEHGFGRAEMRVLQQHLVTPLLDPHIVIIGHPVKADHAETFIEQQLREVIADEPGRSGDENGAHELSFNRIW